MKDPHSKWSMNSKRVQSIQEDFHNLRQKILDVEIKNNQMLSSLKSKSIKNNERTDLDLEFVGFKPNTIYSRQSATERRTVLS